MKEKTKKILKGAGLTLGAVALLTLGVAVGACSAKAGTKQQTAITTPVAKSLIQRPKFATSDDILGTWTPITIPNIDSSSLLVGSTFYATFTNGGVEYSSFYLTLESSGGGTPDMFHKSNILKNGKPKFLPPSSSSSPTSSIQLYYGKNGANVLAYQDYWRLSGDIIITRSGGYTEKFLTFLQTFYTKTGSINPPSSSESSSSEPVTSQPETSQPESSTPEVSLPETKEKIVLNSSYDFRRWFGNVDPTTGAIQFKLPTGISLYSVRVGGLEWQNLGNERIYNCIEFTLQPLNASNALAVSDNLAKTAESLYGDKYNEFCMLSGVYYSYQSGYDGTYTVIQDSALPSVDYRDRIYSMPMVSAQLDGTANNVNALDIRNCVIPSIYRSFGIIEDSEIVFSTNGYSSVTLRQLLGMDFSSVVNYSEGTASAFSLLTQAFGSVAGLLAVQVLPNITLGLLLFLPLIAAVIVLIIKAVKK